MTKKFEPILLIIKYIKRSENRKCVFYNKLTLESPISGGREIWGFPKKHANPQLLMEKDTLLGTLYYHKKLIARATMGLSKPYDLKKLKKSLLEPNYLLKIIPDVDASLKILQLVTYSLKNICLYQASIGKASLELHPHANAPVADLPILEVLSGLHFIADLSLGLGTVVHDYLKA